LYEAAVAKAREAGETGRCWGLESRRVCGALAPWSTPCAKGLAPWSPWPWLCFTCLRRPASGAPMPATRN